jgi:hypothetical protein
VLRRDLAGIDHRDAAARAQCPGDGLVFAVSLFLRAYSLGGGTYTGIEAASSISKNSTPR